MKKLYAKPVIEIETYELSASIALNCQNKVNIGPEAPGHEPCTGFDDDYEIVSIIPGVGIMSNTERTSFYNDGSNNCDCYYSSSGLGYFTS